MSLQEEVLEAAGGARWKGLRRFTGHLTLDGSLLQPILAAHSLREIVAEGDVERRSVRMSGISSDGGAWGFNPDFITIQRGDGAFVGARREVAPRPFRHPKDEVELVYLCGLSIWNCMMAPLVFLSGAAKVEELGAWREAGEIWRRLRIRTQAGFLGYSREKTMYFGDDGLLRRTDFDVECGELMLLADYTSAHQAFSEITMPTLHRVVRRGAGAGEVDPKPVLDIEVFDAAFA